MYERIEEFMNEIHTKKHMMELVKKLDLCLKIEAETGDFHLVFKDGNVTFADGCDKQTDIQATISGKHEFLIQLLDGEIKLRQGVRLNYFYLNCPFRSQLLIESIFYLARPIPV